jgi:hypothetical protein
LLPKLLPLLATPQTLPQQHKQQQQLGIAAQGRQQTLICSWV